MKEVRRRKPRKLQARTMALLLVALLAAIVGGIALLRKPKVPEFLPGAFDSQRPQIELLFSAELEELDAITIKPYKGEAYTLKYHNKQFELMGEPDAPVDQSIAMHMAGTLLHFTALSNLGEISSAHLLPKQVGIDETSLSVSLTLRDGRQFAFRIGDHMLGDLPQDYLMVGGKTMLYGVDTDIRYALDRSRQSLRRLPNINFAPDLLDAYVVESEGQRFALRRVTQELWEIEQPWLAPASLNSVKGLLSKLKELRFASYVGEANPESLKEYGLDNPRLRVSFHLAASSISGQDERGQSLQTIAVPEQVIRLQVGRDIPGTGFYCRYLDGIYQASDLSMGFLFKAQPEQYLGLPFDVPLSLVSELRFETPASGSRQYKLSLTEKVLPNNELMRDAQGNPLYQYDIRADGKEIAAEPVAKLYGELMQLGGFRPLGEDHRVQDADLLLRVQLRFAEGRQREVGFYRYDALHAALLINGRPVSYLPVASLQPLIESLESGALDQPPA